MKISQSNNHGKIYANKPKVLSFVCQYCEKLYTYEFSSAEKNEWYKELKSKTDCPFCGKKRI